LQQHPTGERATRVSLHHHVNPINARQLTRTVIAHRYQGMPGVTLGGYIAGLAAKELGPSVLVTLTRAVPPGSAVIVERTGSEVQLRVDDAPAATAAPTSIASTAPAPITITEAGRASERYLGLHHHFFPRCFACGPQTPEGEGLRIFVGPVGERPLVATIWHPPAIVRSTDGTVASEFLWAALDCPAIWAEIVCGSPGPDDHAVSGRLALRQDGPVPADADYVVLGWPIERDGRKVVAGAAIYSASGDLLVEARQTMILTPHGVPLNPAIWSPEQAAFKGE
jgi:hypothetical protein